MRTDEFMLGMMQAGSQADTSGVQETFVNAISAVLNERIAQDVKWGEQNHPPEVWLTILIEEIGELAECVLKTRFPVKHDPGFEPDGLEVERLKREVVQVAAVSVAFYEYLERSSTATVSTVEVSEGYATFLKLAAALALDDYERSGIIRQANLQSLRDALGCSQIRE